MVLCCSEESGTGIVIIIAMSHTGMYMIMILSVDVHCITMIY